MLTVPNLLSVLRLLGVPLFLWLLLAGVARPRPTSGRSSCWRSAASATGPTASSPACWTSTAGWGSCSTPPVDRLYILAALLGARPARRRAVVGGRRADRPRPGARGVPAAAAPPRLRAAAGGLPGQGGHVPAAVDASRCLLAGLQTGWFADLCRPTGYAFAVWGSALYLYTGALYLAQIVLALTPRAAVDRLTRPYPAHRRPRSVAAGGVAACRVRPVRGHASACPRRLDHEAHRPGPRGMSRLRP